MALFYFIIWVLDHVFFNGSDWLGVSLLFDIIIGAIVFIQLIGLLEADLFSKKIEDKFEVRTYSLVTIGLFVLFFALLGKIVTPNIETNKPESVGSQKCYFNDSWILVSKNDSCSQKVEEYLETKAPKSTVKPAVVPTVKKTSKIIDCIGPYGIHVSLTKEQCIEFNGSWSATEQEVINNTKTNYPIQQPATTTINAPINSYTTGTNYDLPSAPAFESAPSFEPVVYSPPPKSDLKFIEQPVEKECYEVRGGVICK